MGIIDTCIGQGGSVALQRPTCFSSVIIPLPPAASIHQLKWAQSEENANLFLFFGALAELRWVLNESMRQAAEKVLCIYVWGYGSVRVWIWGYALWSIHGCVCVRVWCMGLWRFVWWWHLIPQQLEFSKVFKNIYQDERVLEETRKALEACKTKMAKLQKQACAMCCQGGDVFNKCLY